jgi:glyoxylase-like metal-dependent hydrolase (beta-lactamase superfamily II)
VYTGSVYVGGPAHVRELPQLIISKLAVGPLSNNTYLLRCRATGAQVLIDAANQSDEILTLIGSESLTLILTTHSHPDHWQALAEIVQATGAETCAPMADAHSIDAGTDRELHHGEVVFFGDCALEVITVGGHTAGCSLYLYRDPFGHEHLFSGDALFPGGLGKTNSPEDFKTLFQGVQAHIFERLSDLTWIYPGHGDDTTLGTERPQLREWESRGW